MVSAVIVAAGSGTRMGLKKQFMSICGVPLVAYCLSAFEKSSVDEIVVVTGAEDIFLMKDIADEYGIKKLKTIAVGGETRQQSVQSGLDGVTGDIVLIHDGARPFVKIEDIENVIDELAECPAVAVGYPVKDTIKVVDKDGFVTDTPDRESLMAVATPQGFKTELIRDAHNRAKDEGFQATDDCMIAEHFGYKVKILPCGYDNIKITTAEDVAFAEAIIEGCNDENR